VLAGALALVAHDDAQVGGAESISVHGSIYWQRRTADWQDQIT
jgi:hypothetical protein